MLQLSSGDSYSFARADVEARRVLVTFRARGCPEQRFGVYYSLDSLPIGPMTGEVCDSAELWAAEIGWDLDELIRTGCLERAERIPGPDDVVLLRWWAGESIER